MKEHCLKAEELKNAAESPSNSNNVSPQNQGGSNDIVTDFSKRQCSDFEHLGYECVPKWKCINGKFDQSAR